MAVVKRIYDERLVISGTSTEPTNYTLQTGKTYTAAQYEGNGGAVYVDSYGIVTGENVTFKDNCATASDSQGAAIYNADKAVLTLTSATFTGNSTTGTKGQGAAIYNIGEATLADATFSSNSATMGGAVFNNGGSLVFTGGTIHENSAKYGGAIQNFRGGTIRVTGTVFSGNTAAADGGAISLDSGTATIDGATFSGNTARSKGGAISNQSTLNLANTTFTGNSAKYGGAIYNTSEGTINLTGAVTLATETDGLYNAGTLNWNLDGESASCGSLVGYQYLENDGGTLAITVDGDLAGGSYTLATGDLSSLDGKETFTLTGLEDQSAITVNGESAIYHGKKYTLATDNNGTDADLTDDKLVLTVASLPSVADAAITVSGSCTYNGEAQSVTLTVELDGATLVQGADYTLAYANNVNAGTATVTVTGIGNYVGTKDATFTISAKELTVVGSAADGKTYDGTTVAAVGTIGTLSGIIDGDDVAIDSAVGVFDDKDAGNGKAVQITYTLTGEDALNYSVVSSATCADIAKRSVTLTSADATKEYNGDPLTNDTVNVSGDGWVEGEGATYDVTGSQTEVGTSANAFTYALYDNTKAGNYDITAIEGVLTVTEAQETPPEKPDGGGEGGEGGGGGDTPPEKPDGGGEGGGGDTPPEKPDGGGGEGGGGSEETPTLQGVLQLDSGTQAYDGGDEGATLTSTASDENVVLVQNEASLTLSHYTLDKTGDCSDEDDSNFYAVNAVVAAASGARIYIDHSALDSNAKGANGLFATGEGSTIYAYDCTITSTADSSRGLDATYEGTVIASKLTINTSGSHCAALATDRGDGNISVTDSTLATAGNGSPLIYSTGIIEVDNVTGTATGAQIAGIEGKSTIRIKNSNLSGSGKKASEPVANGVIIYQSMSGDSSEGTATFEVADSTLKSAISGGAMFYVTNTEAVITVQNSVLDFDSDTNHLLMAAGNDGSNGWGTAGANGASVVFTAIDQTLSGAVSVDGISSLDMYLVNSVYTGTFELDTTYTGDGGTDLFISEDSTWIVTGSCTLQTLTVASGAKIQDGSGATVSIVNASGETLVSGTSDLAITVSAYASKKVEAIKTINDFEIDRSEFEEMYSESEPLPAITIIAASADKMYDGSALSNSGYTFTDGVLAEGDTLTATVVGSITDVGTASNKVTSYKVMRGTVDVTDQYTFNTSDGTLTVTKRDVTLTSASGTKAFDGTALENHTVTASGSGFVEGEGATYDVTGTQTAVGSSNNSFTYVLNAGTKVENYDIQTVEGVLSVTAAEVQTPQLQEPVNNGNTTVVSWTTPSQSTFVDIALNTASSDEKLLVRTDGKSIELYSVPETYEMSLKDAASSDWADTVQVSSTASENATAYVSVENNIAELFLVKVNGTWSSQYLAHHVGSILDWNGTDESVDLDGKNKIADTFTGSSDANIMFLTDDANGDALFVDDIFTAFPDEQQSRIAQIDEIRAGSGDDIVDMTSQSFEYIGDGLTVRGGSGDDTIWANKGSNLLFGDAGNDRIVGASGNDAIAGGLGNDSLHGGGGSDVFCFCDDWGQDTVEQLASGNVTLWFASGSEDNWNQDTMTYTDGDNSVKVTGVATVTLKFGDDETAQYDSLLASGAFMEESSDKIFGTEQKGVLATI